MEPLLDIWKALSSIQRIIIIAVAVLLGIDVYLGSPLGAEPHKKAAEYQVGQDIEVAITLVTTDAKTLSCASTEVVNGKHCEFENSKTKWSKPTEGRPGTVDVLAPYKTTDDLLFLIPGLFSEPALKHRLEIDPPTLGQEHARFVANCKLHVEGKIGRLETRWHQNGDWGSMTDAWVGTISNCILSDA